MTVPEGRFSICGAALGQALALLESIATDLMTVLSGR